MVISPVVPFTGCVVVQLESTGYLMVQSVREICANSFPVRTIDHPPFDFQSLSFFPVLSPLFSLVLLRVSVHSSSGKKEINMPFPWKWRWHGWWSAEIAVSRTKLPRYARLPVFRTHFYTRSALLDACLLVTPEMKLPCVVCFFFATCLWYKTNPSLKFPYVLLVFYWNKVIYWTRECCWIINNLKFSVFNYNYHCKDIM